MDGLVGFRARPVSEAAKTGPGRASGGGGGGGGWGPKRGSGSSIANFETNGASVSAATEGREGGKGESEKRGNITVWQFGRFVAEEESKR